MRYHSGMTKLRTTTILFPEELIVTVDGESGKVCFINGFGESLELPLTESMVEKLEFIARSARTAVSG